MISAISTIAYTKWNLSIHKQMSERGFKLPGLTSW